MYFSLSLWKRRLAQRKAATDKEIAFHFGSGGVFCVYLWVAQCPCLCLCLDNITN
jgi:hypothetical protein